MVFWSRSLKRKKKNRFGCKERKVKFNQEMEK